MITRITSLSIHEADEKDEIRDCTPELTKHEDRATQVAKAIQDLIENFNLMPQIQKGLSLEIQRKGSCGRADSEAFAKI